MAKRDAKRRHNREKQFLMLPHWVLNHADFLSLSYPALKLLMHFGSQHNGYNNGNLTASLNQLKPKGWTSNDSLNKAKAELQTKYWIVETWPGGKNRRAMYAVTFLDIDDCKRTHNLIRSAGKKLRPESWAPGKNVSPKPSDGSINTASRSYSGESNGVAGAIEPRSGAVRQQNL